MAQGDFVVFDTFIHELGEEVHDLTNDTFKIGLTDGTTTPATTTPLPRWGAGGTTNFSTEETTGGDYTAPVTITQTWASGATPTFSTAGNTQVAAANGSNPTTCEWGIVYNDTDASKRCVGYLDLNNGADLDTTGGLTVNAGTWFTANQ